MKNKITLLSFILLLTSSIFAQDALKIKYGKQEKWEMGEESAKDPRLAEAELRAMEEIRDFELILYNNQAEYSFVQKIDNLEICAANLRIIRAHIRSICAYTTEGREEGLDLLKMHQLINKEVCIPLEVLGEGEFLLERFQGLFEVYLIINLPEKISFGKIFVPSMITEGAYSVTHFFVERFF